MHLGATAVLLAIARLAVNPLELYFGTRSEFVQALRLTSFPFITGWLTCQVGILGLWCALAHENLVRRLERSLVLLALGWLSLVGFFWIAPRGLSIEVPILSACGLLFAFFSSLVVFGGIGMQYGWQIIRHARIPLKSLLQFSIFDLFRFTTAACIVFAVAAAILAIGEPVVWQGGEIPWYYSSFLISTILVNLLAVPLLVLGVWGLLSESDRRFRHAAIIFNGLGLLLLGARLILFPIVHDYPGTPFWEQLVVLVLGMLVPGLASVWMARRTGFRLVPMTSSMQHRLMKES